jgi:hypothetical protein
MSEDSYIHAFFFGWAGRFNDLTDTVKVSRSSQAGDAQTRTPQTRQIEQLFA